MGKFEEVDERNEAERKAQIVAYRTEKRRSSMFMVVASIGQIIVTFTIVLALFLAVAFLCFRVFGLTGDTVGNYFMALMVIVFGGGMVLGFMLYKYLLRLVIVHTDWKNKLSKDVMIHYFTDDEMNAMKAGKPLPKKAKKNKGDSK